MQPLPLRVLAVAGLMAVAIFFLGNSGGTARAGNFFTGAPSAGGGTERTCSTCHNSGNFGEPAINVSFDDGSGSGGLVTEYIPGQTYTVTVAVGYTDVAPAAYGFSSQFLDTSVDPAVNVGAVASPSTNTRITNANNGRTYVEHSSRSADSLFTFEWTAPEAGTGPVEYYVVGNLVNNAGGTSGDNGSSAPTVVTLAEGEASGVRDLAVLDGALFPNPAVNQTHLRVELPRAGEYELTVTDLTGRTLLRQSHQPPAGTFTFTIPTTTLANGTYAVALRGADHYFIGRLVIAQ